MVRRSVRVLSWLLIALAAAAAVLGGAALAEVAWTGRGLSGVELYRGRLTARYRGPTARMKGPVPGFRIGAPADRRLEISGPGWISEWRRSWWLCDAMALRGGAGPPGVGGAVLMTHVNVHLWRVAGVAGAAGAVLFFVSRRRLGPGQCRVCGYNLDGLTAGAACPECGRGARGAESPIGVADPAAVTVT